MKQYILTRFNLPLWSKDKRKVATATTEWLEDRIRLFETYCLPSVKNQSCQDFTWILLFDAETPEAYKDRARKWTEDFPQIKLVPVKREHAWKWVAVFRSFILNDLKELKIESSELRVVTTYLDNDDALHRDYMSAVRAAAGTAAANTFISFRYGLQYYEEKNYAIELDFKCNHFLSLVEEVSNFEPSETTLNDFKLRTVMGYGGHMHLEEFKGVSRLYLEDKVAWMEVVHQRNMDNDVRWVKFRRVSDKNALAEYGLDKELQTGWLHYAANHYTRIVGQFCIRLTRKLFGKKAM